MDRIAKQNQDPTSLDMAASTLGLDSMRNMININIYIYKYAVLTPKIFATGLPSCLASNCNIQICLYFTTAMA